MVCFGPTAEHGDCGVAAWSISMVIRTQCEYNNRVHPICVFTAQYNGRPGLGLGGGCVSASLKTS